MDRGTDRWTDTTENISFSHSEVGIYLSISQKQHSLKHVEDLAGRLMYRRHYSLVLICSVTLEDGHDLEGESCIQTWGRLLSNL